MTMNTCLRASASAPMVESPNVEDIVVSSETMSITQMQTMIKNMETKMMRNVEATNNQIQMLAQQVTIQRNERDAAQTILVVSVNPYLQP